VGPHPASCRRDCRGGFQSPASDIDWRQLRHHDGACSPESLPGGKKAFTHALPETPPSPNAPCAESSEPLTQMGAQIEAVGDGDTAPLIIRGARLKPIDYQLPARERPGRKALFYWRQFPRTAKPPSLNRGEAATTQSACSNTSGSKTVRHENQLDHLGRPDA